MAGVWKKTLIYLGLAEEEDYEDYAYDDLVEEEPARRPARRAAQPEPHRAPRKDAVVRAMPDRTPEPQRVHLVTPKAFNDAQEVGDRFRDGFSVLMNLQGSDPELARRLVDFASGLAYGLQGAMQPVAEKVFLVTPPGVQVSAEERRRLVEERGFFNQL